MTIPTSSSRGLGRNLRRIAVSSALLIFGLALTPASAPAAAETMLDLSKAVVVAPEGLSPQEKKAVAMLVDEVSKRTALHWEVAKAWPSAAVPVIAVGQADGLRGAVPRDLAGTDRLSAPQAREGYRIAVATSAPAVLVVGSDPRGVLFGVGRLLRELRMTRGRVMLPGSFQVATAPKYPLRGHQLGYRPKTNSYDGWDLALWEQYIRDLAVFGSNAVELIPPRSDDAADSPHFPLPQIEMMAGMSRILDDYGLDVWIWYPAMDRDYSNPETVAFALREWGDVFKRLPRVDAVFVPGGDPGHTQPKYLLELLEKESEVLRRYHPHAAMWVSPQSFDRPWFDEFLALLPAQRPSWLAGLVHGPQVRVSMAELRSLVPSSYPIRNYPDITHSRSCQFPVPDWDVAFALTEAREVINPRPLDQTAIFRATQEAAAIGYITYSEGCNDDVNKIVWSALGWDPETAPVETLRQYGRYFIGDRFAEGFAQGLLALERNWRGPLLDNAGVETTLAQFQDMERAAGPFELRNWRFQQALYRAYYDAYVRDRLIHETELQDEATAQLRRAPQVGAIAAMERASALLERARTNPVAVDRRERVYELAEALFQSIHMQLSVPRYKAIAVGRGANLDTIDVPLNDRVWLEDQFAKIRALGREDERLRAIEAIVRRTDPGPGGFYDDLGNLRQQPHLVRGSGFDPGYMRSALVGFGEQPGWPLSWCQNAQTFYDTPLKMRYDDLDPSARYLVRVVYPPGRSRSRIRLEADGAEVHPLIDKPEPVRPLEFDVPASATADGRLVLTWTPDPGRGGNGQGCAVAEVWLIRKGE